MSDPMTPLYIGHNADGLPCRREALPDSPDGTRHTCCAECEREALSVFGEHWADQARAGVLRPAIVGGVPIDDTTVTTARCVDSPLSRRGVGATPLPSASPVQQGATRATRPALAG